MSPEEPVNTNTPAVTVIAEAPAEPAVVEVAPSVVGEQPVIVEQPAVAEVQVVSGPESPVSVPAESVVEVSAPAVVEPTQNPEQPVETAQPSVLAPGGDLALTPQLLVIEALTPEKTPEKQLPEQPSAPVVSAAEPASEPVKISILSKDIARELLVKARNSIQFRKRKKLDRIMGLFAKQAKNGSTSSPQVTNDDAEKLLHISDATASRYLGILEKEGKIKRVGTAGRWVSYVKA